MIESFNEARLEQYLDDDMAKKCLGYTVKDKIRSIHMQFAGKRMSAVTRILRSL